MDAVGYVGSSQLLPLYCIQAQKIPRRLVLRAFYRSLRTRSETPITDHSGKSQYRSSNRVVYNRIWSELAYTEATRPGLPQWLPLRADGRLAAELAEPVLRLSEVLIWLYGLPACFGMKIAVEVVRAIVITMTTLPGHSTGGP